MKVYDVVVIGAGHAGCEAALAAARLGAETLLMTINPDHIAQMSCNPAIGGVGKGQVVREIDALGGAQGLITDIASIQFRMLNRSKGPAVWSPRAQCDKVCFQRAMKFLLETTPNLAILQAEAVAFTTANDRITGVVNQFGETLPCRSVVVTTGTFLNGKMHYGLQHFPGGRAGDPAASALSAALHGQLGMELGRLKTGTPPRVLAKSVDFSNMGIQLSEEADEQFSYGDHDYTLPPLTPAVRQKTMPCYTVHSTDATAELVRANLDQAPLYQGKIEGIGARYCPSFEDKVVRFPHHPHHLLYLEPEGEATGEYYINGISTSLQPAVQRQMLATLPGFEQVMISRYAYAIEYDFIFPHQMRRTLGSKRWVNFFSAGQINGTSGYEEAAGQGLIAGLNAARSAAGLEPVELARDSSYIGVMIDDLVTKDIIEPYRLFTSRSEYRLTLRQDNADWRLADFAHANGLISERRYRNFCGYREQYGDAMRQLQDIRMQGKTLWQWLKNCHGIWEPGAPLPCPALPEGVTLPELPPRMWSQLTVHAHYDGYIEREAAGIKQLHKLEAWSIPADFCYSSVNALSIESRQKLERVKPSTLAQAARIDGVTPAELALLQILLSRRKGQADA